MIRKRPENKGGGPPAWIISFSDMVTLLLAFFVLLQAFASVRDPELFFVGQDSFRRAIAGLGVPNWLLGKEDRPTREHRKIEHSTEPAAQPIPKNRVLDAEDEKIRQAFEAVKNMAQTEASDTTELEVETLATPVRFADASEALDESGRQYLMRTGRTIREGLRGGTAKIYVLALAPEAGSKNAKWALSAARAQVACEVIREAVLGHAAYDDVSGSWEFHAWGAGGGGIWPKTLGFDADETYVAIVVTREAL
jgi:flagellar motor protein MotB